MFPRTKKSKNCCVGRIGIDVFMTGSNAWMLSGELATFLSGRYVEIQIQPLSFSEYLEGNPAEDERKSYLDYVRYGSFPYVRRLVEQGASDDVDQYLEGILNTVLVKDVLRATGGFLPITQEFAKSA